MNAFANKTLNEAVDAILGGVDKMFQEQSKQIKSVDHSLIALENKIDKVETDIVFIKRDIRGIKAELSDTPTLRQFNELKAKVS